MAKLSMPAHNGAHLPEKPGLPREEADIPPSVMSAVHERDRGLCQYCLMQGSVTPGVVYDLFIPASAGGEGIIANVQLACEECNRRKGHLHPKDVFGADWQAWAPGKPRHSHAPRRWS